MLSLSTIIYDSNNSINLPNNYKSPDMPSIEMYNNVINGKICDKSIIFHPIYGIDIEIASNYIDTVLSYIRRNRYLTPVIHWIRWEEVLYFNKLDYKMNWIEQINSGILYKELPAYEKIADRKLEIKEDPRCFITNIPIYEDCYVIDIYEQIILYKVKRSELEEELKNGSVIVGNTEEKKSKYINLKKKVIYDKPFRLLISPYTLHFYLNYCDFTSITNTKIIFYRTFCPRLAIDVIDNLPDVSNVYKNVLKAFNGTFKNKHSEYEAIVKGNKYILHNSTSHKQDKFLLTYSKNRHATLKGISIL